MRRERRPQQLLQRVERARRVVSHCSQAAIRAYDEEALLSEACRHLIDQGGYCMAWFAESQVGQTGLRSLAHAGSEPSGVRGEQLPWAVAAGQRSPTARALLEQRPQVIRGIPSDPALLEKYPDSVTMGYAALCAFPLQFGPHGAGVLTVFAREPDAFAAEEVALLRELAGDMAVAISVLRARKVNDALAERLEAAERRYRSIVENAPVGVVQVAADGRVLLANQALATVLGYPSPDQVQGLDGPQLARHLRPVDLARLRQQVAQGPPYQPFEVELRRLDGSHVWAELRAKPANGGLEGAFEAFVRDLSAERTAAAAQQAVDRQHREVVRLQELERMRAEFMGRASHELNTPLTPILLQVQALQGASQDPRQVRGLALIERNVLRLAGLVKDLLAASALKARDIALQPTSIDLAEKATEAVAASDAKAKAAGIDLRLEADGKVPAFADGSRVVQVLLNLVGNAIKFTPRGGSVVVRCEQLAGGISRCAVSDNGRGFRAADAGKLFAPFGRIHEHLPADPGGTGMGLFISKSIVEQCGGSLWASSPGPDQGSAFAFTLPSMAPEPPGRGIVAAAGFGAEGGPAGREPEGPVAEAAPARILPEAA